MINLHLIDISIIVVYILLTFFIGLYVSKKAATGIKSYFLGENNMKWYWLGLSNSSGMFDVNAVSWRVGLFIMYGMQSVWIPWVWPVWNQVFVMIFLSAWLRRSGAMTGAEWMRIRFGDGLGGKLSHFIVVIFAVVEVTISIGTFFTGIGGLAAELLPSLAVRNYDKVLIESSTMYATIICLLTTLYSIKGGIYSIVATEVLQFIIMSICCVIVLYVGWTNVDAQTIQDFIPNGWLDFLPKSKIDYAWKNNYPLVERETTEHGFKMLAGMVGLMVGKGLVASLAGPVPGFDMQRSLSSQSPKDAAKMSGFTILVLFIPLYLMVGGFTLLAIKELPHSIDTLAKIEHIFNIIVKQLPIGVKGLVIAGLLAAFMSTFSAFVNVAPAYLVNDLYKRYLRPQESDQHYVKFGKLISWVVVIVGILIGTQIKSLNDIILFITGAFYGGYAAPNVLKWIWWRFNGYGYFVGMMCGMIAAMFSKELVIHFAENFPTLKAMAATQAVNLMAFVFIFCCSLLGCFLGSLLFPKTDTNTTLAFYMQTRPWGFWQPIIHLAKQKDPSFEENKDFIRDTINIVIGIIWQMSMVVLPLYLAFRQWQTAFIAFIVFVVTSFLLKKNWYDHIK